MRFRVSVLLTLALLLVLGGTAGHAQRGQTPRATITFDNQSGQFALVKVVGPTRRQAQVPNAQKRTVTVAGGQYYILTRYGTDPKAYTYSKGNTFQVTQTARQHSVITITLHKVVGGNYQTTAVPASEFESQ
jgi:hypothetical protein